MSAPFNNFLSGNTGQVLKSYAHASGLYVNDVKMPRAPKLGFIYFVSFNVNPALGVTQSWVDNLGFLAKKVDLPKFKVSTQTLNQYNRKTNIQTKLTYEPISIEFHDDNSEITSSLWRMYYDSYYRESLYNDGGNFGGEILGDSKYDESPIQYGYGPQSLQTQFFTSIDIFSLHQGRFSQYSISNPMISSWDHDSLDQSNGTKVLQNKMSLVYDSVAYYQGEIVESDKAQRYKAVWYDNNIGLPNGYPQPANVKIPSPQVQYPTPIPQGASLSEREKIAVKATPAYPMPRPLGAGTFGLGQNRPKQFGLSGINVWYGHGGLHGTGVVNAGPIRLVLKK